MIANKMVQSDFYKCSGTGIICNNFFCLLVFAIVLVTVSSGDDSSSISGDSTSANSGTLQNVNHIVEYLYSLRRSQDEIFRKIDWLIKVVEERDREEHKFRVKFSRKVHTLENKVLYLEKTLTQKVEEIVDRKINEWSEWYQQKNHNHRYNHYLTASEPSKISGSQDHHDQDDDNEGIQNHQPLPYNIRYQPPQQQQHYSPYQHIRHEPHHQNNWGFYEHPITHKKVRDGNIFKYEPPTRDLPLISLVATTSTQLSPADVKGASSSSLPPSSPSMISPVRESEGRNGGPTVYPRAIPSEFIEESQKKFESFEVALKVLRGNITHLEREMSRGMMTDNSDMHNILSENSREIMNLHKKHQEMVQRIEYFTVEMEKAAAKREHAINESIKEISSDMKKQISSVKAYTKRQIQNLNATTTSNTIDNQSRSVLDKTRCAQTLLDELITQINKQKSRYPALHLTPSLVQPDLIADQAETENDESEFGKLILQSGIKKSSAETTEKLIKELELQRKEILELKSEIGRLNISQVLLMRTVDEETLKRTVRPRDCSEIRLLRNVSSGIFSVFPLKNDASIDVYCDMQTDGGGWSVIQRRGSPIEENENSEKSRESFLRSWDEYEEGFGQLNGDHWLGLKNIAALCQLGIQQLRIDMTNWSGESRYAIYQYFKISNASEKYKINVHGYSGTAGDSLSRHDGMSFSTPDNDNDADPRRHCAKTYFSGWWYYACFESNLNGIFIDENNKNGTRAFGTGIIWQHWLGHYGSLKNVEMKIRNTFIGENHYLKRFI